jgi:hypothetical protein
MLCAIRAKERPTAFLQSTLPQPVFMVVLFPNF